MFTALIAEDELLVRIGIASCVPWSEMNIRVIAEVEDGKSAWQAYTQYHPDLVIMDIRMPEMDGMELLHRIREEDRQCAVIVVTNVEYDETLKEARSLGVSEILLKATMKQEDIRMAVEKAIAAFSDRRTEKATVSVNDGWQRVLLDPSVTNIPEIPFAVHGAALMYLFPSERISHRLSQSLTQLILHELGESGKATAVSMESGALFLFEKLETLKGLTSYLEEMKNYIAANFYVETGFVVCGEPLTSAGMKKLFQRMKKLTAEQAYLKKGTLLLDAEGNDANPALKVLKKKTEQLSSVMHRNTELVEFSRALSLYPGDMTEGWNTVRERGYKVLRILKAEEESNHLSSLTSRVCKAGEILLEKLTQSVKPEILTVINYMNAHIGEDLAIPKVSALIGYQPKYFSHLFKNEIGSNYSDFLTELRIDHARKKLRESRASIQEIAEQCGFSELAYFSHKFKQQTGMTPKQWRDQK